MMVDCCGCILLAAWLSNFYEHSFSQISGLGAVGTQTLGVDGTKFLNDSDFQSG
jgi:hypothetical protein